MKRMVSLPGRRQVAAVAAATNAEAQPEEATQSEPVVRTDMDMDIAGPVGTLAGTDGVHNVGEPVAESLDIAALRDFAAGSGPDTATRSPEAIEAAASLSLLPPVAMLLLALTFRAPSDSTAGLL